MSDGPPIFSAICIDDMEGYPLQWRRIVAAPWCSFIMDEPDPSRYQVGEQLVVTNPECNARVFLRRGVDGWITESIKRIV